MKTGLDNRQRGGNGHHGQKGLHGQGTFFIRGLQYLQDNLKGPKQ